jgi:hypothetical protein
VDARFESSPPRFLNKVPTARFVSMRDLQALSVDLLTAPCPCCGKVLSVPAIYPVVVLLAILHRIELPLEAVVLLKLLLGLDIGCILVQHRLRALVVALVGELLVEVALLDKGGTVSLGLR